MAPPAGIREGRAGGRAHTRFHGGELAVQRRAGVERVAAQVRRVWASPLVGGVGFASVLAERNLAAI